MKRTNVVVDEELLEEACRITGERTWSAVIDVALKEVIRRHKARQILALEGTGWWQGDLDEMRGKKAVTVAPPSISRIADRPGPDDVAEPTPVSTVKTPRKGSRKGRS